MHNYGCGCLQWQQAPVVCCDAYPAQLHPLIKCAHFLLKKQDGNCHNATLKASKWHTTNQRVTSQRQHLLFYKISVTDFMEILGNIYLFNVFASQMADDLSLNYNFPSVFTTVNLMQTLFFRLLEILALNITSFHLLSNSKERARIFCRLITVQTFHSVSIYTNKQSSQKADKAVM